MQAEIRHLRIKAHGKEAAIQTSKEDRSLTEDPWWNCCAVATPELLDNKNGNHQTETKQAAPNLGCLPWIRGSSPLES